LAAVGGQRACGSLQGLLLTYRIADRRASPMMRTMRVILVLVSALAIGLLIMGMWRDCKTRTGSAAHRR